MLNEGFEGSFVHFFPDRMHAMVLCFRHFHRFPHVPKNSTILLIDIAIHFNGPFPSPYSESNIDSPQSRLHQFQSKHCVVICFKQSFNFVPTRKIHHQNSSGCVHYADQCSQQLLQFDPFLDWIISAADQIHRHGVIVLNLHLDFIKNLVKNDKNSYFGMIFMIHWFNESIEIKALW